MARVVSPGVTLAPAYAKKRRVQRRPAHRFNLKMKPYQLQPFMIAPVLPGETMNSLMLQSQAWSDPLAGGPMKNIGWWKEYYFFYVKHTDLLGYTAAVDGLGKDLVDMFVSNEALTPWRDADGNTNTYCPIGGIDFTLEALKSIVENHFRDQGETWDNMLVDGLPVAKIYGRGLSDWSESLTMQSAYQDRAEDLPDEIDELDDAYAEWAAQVDAGLMTMTYEDWMRTYGGGTSDRNSLSPDANEHPDLHIPEVLCHWREYTMPTNTVEPTTGVPATAVGWRTVQRENKKHRFNFPGWIIGLTCQRPKVYLRYQGGSIAAMMQTRASWLPAILSQHPDASHLQMVKTEGPLANLVGAETHYWIDLKDLLNHSDQFVNCAPADAPPFVDLPTTAGQRRYPSAGDVMQFFTDTVNGRFLEDGVVSLSIMGRQQDELDNMVLGKT